jgi:hypothetical protein
VDPVDALDNPDVTAIRSLLDTLWQAFVERCMFYNADSNWLEY